MDGSYTVGGTNPDFATLQLAADALNANGVSGPVFVNLRPGVYMENGGNNVVMLLDSVVTGLSSGNRITFQPDDAAGGNVDNVILEMNRTNINTSDPQLVFVKLDYVTFNRITFRHLDSLSMFNNSLIRIEGSSLNLIVDDFVVDACRFVGSSVGTPTGSRGTQNGIKGNQQISSATITNNKFYDIRWGVSIENGAGPRAGTVIVEDNEVYGSFLGGIAIRIAAENATVRRNFIDFMGQTATAGIGVFFSSVAFVEQNIIKNAAGGIFTGIDIKGIPSVVPDSIIVANNIIVDNIGSTSNGIVVSSANTKILHNTILIPSTSIIEAIKIIEENCSLINNIVIIGDVGFSGVVLHLGESDQSAGLTSDNNILFYQGPGAGAGNRVAFRNSNNYVSLLDYQTATGLDSNSVFKQIDFISDSLGIYLDNCQVQDADLIGIPLSSVQFDYYGNARDPVKPFKGAVEGFPVPYDMFAAPFKTGLAGTAFSIATGIFDNLISNGIAVPDYDNNQIHLYHYNGDRTFSHSGTLTTEFQPTVVKFFDLDQDSNLDLIVGGESEVVKVFWGDGIGGFSATTTLDLEGRIRSIEIGKDNFRNKETVFFTIDNGFLPNTSFIQFIVNNGGRNISAWIVQRPGPCCFNPDTIYSVLTDLEFGNLDGDPDDEMAVLAISIPSEFYIFNDTTAQNGGGFLTYGTHYIYSFGTSPYLGHSSSIVMEDFDEDSDLDMISTGSSTSQIIFIKNQGNFGFTSEVIPGNSTFGLVSLDYENDGDIDFVTVNDPMQEKGLTVFLNNGTGEFTSKEQCFFPFASGYPYGIVASDFDLDGRTDIAVVTGLDSLFVLYNLGGGLVGVDNQTISQVPTEFSLSQNYPNPFNPTTTIKYSLPNESNVKISVFNILGEKVKELVNNQMPAGVHTVNFNADNLASGVYIYQIEARTLSGNTNFISAKKMILLR
jgi:hypothetical protein